MTGNAPVNAAMWETVPRLLALHRYVLSGQSPLT